MTEFSKGKQSVINVIDSLENEIKRLTALLEEDIPMPMKDNPKKLSSSDFSFSAGYEKLYLHSGYNYWFKKKPYYGEWTYLSTVAEMDARKAEIESCIKAYETALEERVESDKLIAAHNQVIHDKITQIMTRLGVSGYSTYDFPTARSRTKKETRHTAGYLGDLNRVAPKPCAYEYKLKTEPKQLREQLQRSYDEAKRSVQEAENKARKEKEAAEEVHQLALLRAKYTPEDAMSDKYDIIRAMLEKDKYLRLAHFLERNRGDWNDGYSLAECGISDFSVETDEDKEIYDCIQNIINSEDVDGRYFRDCEYSYGVLYGKVVDQVLLKDYTELNSKVEWY